MASHAAHTPAVNGITICFQGRLGRIPGAAVNVRSERTEAMKLEYLGEHLSRTSYRIPYFPGAVPAGFPSPADDYMDRKLDLNEHLIKHPAATFYCRVSGSSMKGLGIFDGDLLIVDRAVEPEHGSVVVAVIDGEMTCKILDRKRCCLLSANDDYPPIPVGEDADMIIEGVVIHSIRSHRHVRPR